MDRWRGATGEALVLLDSEPQKKKMKKKKE
jgi:hypothetical protein